MELRGDEEGIGVMQESELAGKEKGWLGRVVGQPDGRTEGAVDSINPAVAEEGSSLIAALPEPFHVTDGHAVGHLKLRSGR